MENNGLESRICPFDGESFQPKRINQIFCCPKHQELYYNRTRAIRNKRAKFYINKIMNNRSILRAINRDKRIPDNEVSQSYLKDHGYSFGYLTHMGDDKTDNAKIYRVCEYGYKMINNKYQILKK